MTATTTNTEISTIITTTTEFSSVSTTSIEHLPEDVFSIMIYNRWVSLSELFSLSCITRKMYSMCRLYEKFYLNWREEKVRRKREGKKQDEGAFFQEFIDEKVVSKVRHAYFSPSKLCFKVNSRALPRMDVSETNIAYHHGYGGIGVIPFPMESLGNSPEAQFTLDSSSHTVEVAWNPFHRKILAGAYDDRTVKIWDIESKSITMTLQNKQTNLKTGIFDGISWHPVADGILCSFSSEAVKIWSIEKSQCVITLENYGSAIHSARWNVDGSKLAVGTKDNKIHLCDPRTPATTSINTTVILSHRPFSFTWLGISDWIVSSGTMKNNSRQLAVWDPRKMDSYVEARQLLSSPGNMISNYDSGTNVLFLCTQGDCSVMYYEIGGSGGKCLNDLGCYRSLFPTQGIGLAPSRTCQLPALARLFQLESDGIRQLSFVKAQYKNPENSDSWEFREIEAGIPAMAAQEWMWGRNAFPVVKPKM